jgi:DNA adenine methylase
MRYMGSKRRIANQILPVILAGRKPGQTYVEPFCGGCNTLELVTGKRIAGDIHPELIAMYKALQKGWLPPKRITEEEYKRIMINGSPELKGYAGFTHSFGGKYGSTYRRNGGSKFGESTKGLYTNISYVGLQAFKMVVEQVKLLNGTKFYNCSYYELEIPKQSIIYCDPPYEGTSTYEVKKFYSSNFWIWVENMIAEGHTVFVSEYKAPKHFKCVWEQEVKTHLNSHRGKAFTVVEKLFTL